MNRAETPPPVREHALTLKEVLDLLAEDGLIKPAWGSALLAAQRGAEQPDHPLTVVASRDWSTPGTPAHKISLEFLMRWLSQRTGLPWQRIDPLSIDVTRITSVMSYSYAANLNILPVKVTETEVTIATAEPYVRAWEKDLHGIVKQDIKRVLASPADIRHYLVEFYAIARSVKAGASERRDLSNLQNLEQLTELGRTGKIDADDQHIVKVVDWLLQYAFGQRASDIHLEPRRDQGNVRFRIDGVLHDVYQLPGPVVAAVTSRLKILARMDLAEKRRPQDGRIKTRTPEGREVEMRVSSLPTAFGEKLVMRIFDPEVLVRDFGELGFSPLDVQKWDRMVRHPSGIVLVTGPTGSGKTTTLYSTLKKLATPEVNVCTIEDPIELVEPAFNQMQVNPVIDLNFADGVRALLRQDPDIIMVGEIRDRETAEIATQAALTGHLVLSTLHTNDAPAAIPRLLELGVAPYLIRATLLGVVAQRLVRRLCPRCRAPVEMDARRWRQISGGATVPKPDTVYESAGCLECRETGYWGRTGLYEIMTADRGIKELFDPEVDHTQLRGAALRNGMVSLRQSGFQKIASGMTSIDEVLRTVPGGDASTRG